MRAINRDSLPHLVNCLIRSQRKKRHTLRAYLLAKWWRIDIGKACWFDGAIHFKRHPNSSMVIGNGCGFLSHPHSNLVGINRPCVISTLKERAELSIGKNCGLSGTVIACAKNIRLGCNVRCGANTLINDTDWHTDDSRTERDAPVDIADNVWLGVNVIVLKGVNIGSGTLVGAGSVVNKSLPNGVVAAGVPARVIRRLTSEG